MLRNSSFATFGVVWLGLNLASPLMRPMVAEPALPEDVEIQLVNDLSDTLAVKLNGSSCTEFNQILDDAQADASKDQQGSTVIQQVLEDVKTNPKLRTIVISKLGTPLLTKTLSCNLTPIGALGDETASIQNIDQLSTALAAVLVGSDCPGFNQLLDDSQASAEMENSDESLTVVNQLLADAKTNPQSQSVMIGTLGDPLLGKILDCNLIPVTALR